MKAIECELATRLGRQVDCAQYVLRFSEFADVVSDVFAKTADFAPPPAVGEPSWASGLSGMAGSAESVGRFRAVRQHAEGGLGRIWLAIDAELKREVALKEIRPDQAAHQERRNPDQPFSTCPNSRSTGTARPKIETSTLSRARSSSVGGASTR